MACRVTATAKSGKYRIETEYVTDPGREHGADARHVRRRSRAGYRLYVRFDPTVNGNGGGGAGNGGADSATVDTLDRPPGARRLRPEHGDERGQPRLRAAGLRGARRRPSPRPRAASPAPSSDGLVQLDASHALTTDVRRRDRTATSSRPRASRVGPRRQGRRSRSASARPRRRPSARPRARSARRFDKTLARLQEGLEAYDNTLNKPDREARRARRPSGPTSSRTSTT